MKNLLPLIFVFAGAHVHASEQFVPTRIYSITKQEGSVTVDGHGKYISTHNISFTNPYVHPASVKKGCFILFDSLGTQVPASSTESGLLQVFKAGENKSGKILFISDSSKIYTLPFIKWSDTECHRNTLKKLALTGQ